MADRKTFETVIDLIPVYGQVYAAYFKVFDFAENFDRQDPVATALAQLQGQIGQLKANIAHLNQRINDIQRQVITNENKTRMQRIVDIVDRIERLQFQLSLQPSNSDTRAVMAFDGGQLSKSWLDDFDLWLWTDIQTTLHFDDYGHPLDPEIAALPPDFKTYPALPVYLAAVMTWLLAIDFATGGSFEAVQKRYGPELRRHISQVEFRAGWDVLNDDPQTFPEHIAKRITCYPQAFDRYAKNGECRFSIFCNNIIDRRVTVVDGSDFVTPSDDGSLCTGNPNAGLGYETDIQADRGVTALTELAGALRRVESTGSLRPAFQGHLDTTPFYNKSYLYVVNEGGELIWWKQQPSTAPGTLSGWAGPSTVGYGWGDFLSITPAGGNNFYALRPDGVLLWYQHQGFNDGSFKWAGPVDIGATGWNAVAHIVPGGDGVLYAIESDGTMKWWCHQGYTHGEGAQSWLGPVEQRATWDQYTQVFSGGLGVLYGVRPDGVLHWFRHNGFRDGGNYWEGPREVGSGWHDFTSIVGIGEGIVYATRPDGALIWLRHRGWQTGGPVGTWDTAVVAAAHGWTGYRHIFGLMLATQERPV